MDNVYELVALIDVYAAEKGWDKTKTGAEELKNKVTE